MRKAMLKNEVLRRCEGVGRLLLRSPGEHIKMNDKKSQREGNDGQAFRKIIIHVELQIWNTHPSRKILN